ncbi:MAG: 5-formyltetrahydrofolate cyclo-ligase [Gammaproteobacteria bacterium]|nr:5-formyltetrahydrofolate cyclo-ligase [Gammaproteobacteria bacterium]
MDKASVRSKIKQERRRLGREFCHNAAKTLNPFQHIAVYLSHDNEMDLSPLIQELWAQGKKVYLPLLHSERENELCFTLYTPSTLLKPNKYGILEPEYIASQLIEISKLEAVLMPLIAFDRQGHRLGTGGGYYDRTFSPAKITKAPLLIGCAYQFQFCDMLPAEAHDVPMDSVVTEQQIYQFRERGSD